VIFVCLCYSSSCGKMKSMIVAYHCRSSWIPDSYLTLMHLFSDRYTRIHNSCTIIYNFFIVMFLVFKFVFKILL